MSFLETLTIVYWYEVKNTDNVYIFHSNLVVLFTEMKAIGLIKIVEKV